MKIRYRKWGLRIVATGIVILGLLVVIVLNPMLVYANKTAAGNYTICSQNRPDPYFIEHLNDVTNLLKASELYEGKQKLTICMNDGSVFPCLVQAIQGRAFAYGYYGNVVLNAAGTIHALNLQASYMAGINVMIILGLVRIIDAGTGVNGMVIITSPHWRFDFYSGIIMILLILPTNYFLIKQFGIIGSAYAQLISMTVYNYIRFDFIRRKFNMQPFDKKTVLSILLTAAAFGVAYLVGGFFVRWVAIIIKFILFSGLMIVGIFVFRLSPDAHQLWEKLVLRRLKASS